MAPIYCVRTVSLMPWNDAKPPSSGWPPIPVDDDERFVLKPRTCCETVRGNNVNKRWILEQDQHLLKERCTVEPVLNDLSYERPLGLNDRFRWHLNMGRIWFFYLLWGTTRTTCIERPLLLGRRGGLSRQVLLYIEISNQNKFSFINLQLRHIHAIIVT